MKTVFISSTSRDLAEYRAAAVEICLRLGYIPIAMEYFTAMPVGATAGSLKKLDTADLYVGIFAHRYGTVEDLADGRSVTHAEFDHAGELRLDRLCFAVNPTVSWPDEFKDHEQADKLAAFRAQVDKLIRAEFTTVDNFSKLLMQALVEWGRDNPDRPGAMEAIFATTPDDIPDKPRTLFGRNDLLARVMQNLKSETPVLLQGFGGEGKTALAATLAAQWIAQGDGGVLWLRAGSSELEALLQALARPFNAHQEIARVTGDAAAVLMKQILRGGGVRLVVLDDCWNGKALFALLRCLPDSLPILLTARQRYPIEGDIRDVDALTPDAALALLRTHARDTLKMEDAAEAAALCADLKHHAFGIEVAGKTLLANRWTPKLLREKIADAPHDLTMPLNFVREGRENTAQLLQTSLNALPDDARTVFFACGAFFAPRLTAEMVACYLGGKPPVDSLVVLGQHGLLTPILSTDISINSYRFHDLAYSYASSKISIEDRRRALRACLLFVRFYGNNSRQHFAALRPELENLLGAANWATVHEHDEAVEEFAWVLYVGNDRQGGFLERQGLLAQSFPLLQNAVVAARRLGNPLNESAHLGNLGTAYSILGKFKEALNYYHEAHSIAVKVGNEHDKAVYLGNMGIAYHNLRQRERAREYHEKALEIYRKFNNRIGEAGALLNLGIVYLDLDRPWKAIKYYDEALSISRETGDLRAQEHALHGLGTSYNKTRRVEEAIIFYEKSLRISKEIGDRISESHTLNNLGNIYADHYGEYQRALDYYGRALTIRIEIGAHHLIATTERNIAIVRRKMEEATERTQPD